MDKEPYYNPETKTLFLNRIYAPAILKRISWYNPKKMDTPINFLITAINEAENALIDHYLKKSTSEEEKALIKNTLSHINLEAIVSNGNGNKASAYSSLKEILQIITIKQRSKEYSFSSDNSIRFRNYERPYKAWREVCGIVNVCGDYRMSWESALRKLGAEGIHGLDNKGIPFYVVVWADFSLTEDLIRNEKL